MHEPISFHWIGNRCLAVHRSRGGSWVGFGKTVTAYGDGRVWAFWIGPLTLSCTTFDKL